MSGFPMIPSSTSRLEQMMPATGDVGSHLRARATAVLQILKQLSGKISPADLVAFASAQLPGKAPAARKGAAPSRAEPAPLDAAEMWALATEPLLAAGTATDTAAALHRAAAEQLDALTYLLDQIRTELRPMMTHTRLAEGAVQPLHDAEALDTSIEALLELSRKNAATRPKDRELTAA